MSILRIEAFSCGKTHASPQDNEDAYVLFPGHLYAVIDGATDRLGTRYNGMFAGRYAAMLVKQTIEETYLHHQGHLPEFAKLLKAINQKIQDAYAAHGILEKARTNATYRFTAALALVEHAANYLQIHTIGDCGVRLNGTHTIRMSKDLDHITALLRQVGWYHLETQKLEGDKPEQASRRLCMQGLSFLQDEDYQFFDVAAISMIRERAFAKARSDLPHVPEILIHHLLEHGIIHGQHRYQNCTKTCLGYAAIDGFDIPMALVGIHRIPLVGIKSIELFSDGYFEPPDGFGIAAWEESHRQVEAQDPAKVRFWLGPKGTMSTQWTDDRTYLGLMYDPSSQIEPKPAQSLA